VQDWAAVHYVPAPPAWPTVSEAGARFTRQRDAMPGYRFGITEQMNLRAWPALPPVELPSTLPADKATSYRWFRESVLPIAGEVAPALPDAWFAWGRHRGVDQIVYSEQCLSADFCLQLQRWPLLEEAK
jgi:hypothetical protein